MPLESVILAHTNMPVILTRLDIYEPADPVQCHSPPLRHLLLLYILAVVITVISFISIL